MIKVNKIGAGISYQDHGRVGENSWLNFGVAPAGALDLYSAHAANTLVHNLRTDAVLEIMLGGCELEVLQNCWLGHAGGCASTELPSWTARYVAAGKVLHFNPSTKGVWSYLAIAGGWQVEKIFGSVSRQKRSDIGYQIELNTLLTANELQPSAQAGIARRILPISDQRDFTAPPALRVYTGPHKKLVGEKIFRHLIESTWAISPRSDRTGYRITGATSAALQHSISIHSTPTLVGSIQLPPSGEPIVTLNDGPTVGGYPIIGRIHPDDLSWLIQQHAHRPITFQLIEHDA